jgi:hypothetical protein
MAGLGPRNNRAIRRHRRRLSGLRGEPTLQARLAHRPSMRMQRRRSYSTVPGSRAGCFARHRESYGQGVIRQVGGVLKGIVGRPPCQGPSDVGLRRHVDGRNHLVDHYFPLVRSLAAILRDGEPRRKFRGMTACEASRSLRSGRRRDQRALSTGACPLWFWVASFPKAASTLPPRVNPSSESVFDGHFLSARGHTLPATIKLRPAG